MNYEMHACVSELDCTKNPYLKSTYTCGARLLIN